MAKARSSLIVVRLTRHEAFCAKAALAQYIGRMVKESTNSDARDILMGQSGSLRALVTLNEALEGR